MNPQLVNLALLEIGISIISGVLILFLTYVIVNRLIKRKYEIKDDNVAYAIFTASILFSVGYTVSSVIEPLTSTLRLFIAHTESVGSIIGNVLKYFAVFFLISTIIALVINVIGISLFTVMTTKIEEFDEIKKNNIAVALITGAIIVVLTLFTKDGILFLLDSIVPYPELPAQ